MSASSGVARGRLATERKNWRKDHPFAFVAKPDTAADGSVNLMHWKCKVPGKAGTIWEKGLYPVDLIFSENYPSKPPDARLPLGFFHPNVYPKGMICLSILNAEKAWRPAISIKQILIGIQDLLSDPNNNDPAQQEGYDVYRTNKKEYNRRVLAQALKYAPQ